MRPEPRGTERFLQAGSGGLAREWHCLLAAREPLEPSPGEGHGRSGPRAPAGRLASGLLQARPGPP